MGIPFQSLSLLLLPGRCAVRVHLLRIRFHRVYVAHAAAGIPNLFVELEFRRKWHLSFVYARLWRSTLAVTPHRVVECFLFISISIRKPRLKITITNKSPPNIIPLDVYKIDGRMFALLWNGCRRYGINYENRALHWFSVYKWPGSEEERSVWSEFINFLWNH